MIFYDFQNSQKVEYLDLSENRFDELSGEILGPAIAENTSIKELNLSWNYFRLSGAIAVARGIGVSFPQALIKDNLS